MILRDEFHLSVFVPDDEKEMDDDPLGSILDSPAFHNELLQAIRQVFQQQPALHHVVAKLSR